MKYIKTYEELKEPEVGDYVVLDPTNFTWMKNIVKSSIGKIENIHKNGEYKVIFQDAISSSVITYRYEIIAFSKNKAELEHYITANKFNI